MKVHFEKTSTGQVKAFSKEAPLCAAYGDDKKAALDKFQSRLNMAHKKDGMALTPLDSESCYYRICGCGRCRICGQPKHCAQHGSVLGEPERVWDHYFYPASAGKFGP